VHTLEVNKMLHQAHEQKIGVWNQDEVSPASFMLSYKLSNAVLNWTPHATTRVLCDGQEAEVIIHQDETLLHLRENGNYITQLIANSNKDEARLRSFTCETIPFSVHAYQNSDI
jgi:hypothetical protein